MVATEMMVDLGTLDALVTKLTMVKSVTNVTTKMSVTTVVVTVSRPSCIVAVILFGLNQNLKAQKNFSRKKSPILICKQISPVSADLL